MIRCEGQGCPSAAISSPTEATGCQIRPFPAARPTLASDARFVRQLQQRIAELERELDHKANVISTLADRAYVLRGWYA